VWQGLRRSAARGSKARGPTHGAVAHTRPGARKPTAAGLTLRVARPPAGKAFEDKKRRRGSDGGSFGGSELVACLRELVEQRAEIRNNEATPQPPPSPHPLLRPEPNRAVQAIFMCQFMQKCRNKDKCQVSLLPRAPPRRRPAVGTARAPRRGASDAARRWGGGRKRAAPHLPTVLPTIQPSVARAALRALGRDWQACKIERQINEEVFAPLERDRLKRPK
jgi:hypothetical protein